MTRDDSARKDASPFELSAVCTIAHLNSQIEACDDLLSRLSALEEQKSELQWAEKELAERARAIDEHDTAQLEEAARKASGARDARAAAEAKARECELLLEDKRNRLEGLESGRLFPEEIARVAAVVEEKSAPVNEVIAGLENEAAEVRALIHNTGEAIRLGQAELESLREDLETFSNGDIPGRLMQAVQAASRGATAAREREIRGARDRIAELTDRCDKTDTSIKTLNVQITELKKKCLEVERASKRSLFRRVGSAAWVTSFFTDYEKEAQEAQSRWSLLVEELSRSMRELAQAQQVHRDLVSSRPRVNEEAADAERERQRSLCKKRVEALPGILCQSEEELASAKTRLRSLEDGLDSSRTNLEQVTNDAAETARRELVEELKSGLDELNAELTEITEEWAVARSHALESAEILERLRTDLARQKDEEMQGMVASLDEMRKALSPAEEALLESAGEIGIKGPMERIREGITARRSDLESELRRERDGLASSDDGGIDGAAGVIRKKIRENVEIFSHYSVTSQRDSVES